MIPPTPCPPTTPLPLIHPNRSPAPSCSPHPYPPDLTTRAFPPALPPSSVAPARRLRVTYASPGNSHRQRDKADTDPHTSHRVPGRVSCTTGGVVSGSRSCCTGARLTPRLTPSVTRRTRLTASTSTRTRTRARAARHSSSLQISLQRIVSSSTGRVLPARCSLHILHSLE